MRILVLCGVLISIVMVLIAAFAPPAHGQTQPTAPVWCDVITHTTGKPYPHTYCRWSADKALTPTAVRQLFTQHGLHEGVKINPQVYCFNLTPSTPAEFRQRVANGFNPAADRFRGATGNTCMVRTDIPDTSTRGEACYRFVQFSGKAAARTGGAIAAEPCVPTAANTTWEIQSIKRRD